MSVLDRRPPTADHRLQYGTLPLQFGDLWIPDAISAPQITATPLHATSSQRAAPVHLVHRWPLVVFLHGGWWQSSFNLAYTGFLAAALKTQGVAVWSLEYRRVGDEGGGWPGTMQDVAAGMDFVLKLAEQFPLDTSRVIAAGHSAGGQLAFWLAARHHIPHDSVLADPQPNLALKGVVALAGAVDLRLTLNLFTLSSGPAAVRSLMGGTPQQVPARYSAADPGELLPLGVPQILVQGLDDDQIPAELPSDWAKAATRQGDQVEVKLVPGADHFDVVDPQSRAWPVCRDAMLKLLRD